jgi:hypothetical protein
VVLKVVACKLNACKLAINYVQEEGCIVKCKEVISMDMLRPSEAKISIDWVCSKELSILACF